MPYSPANLRLALIVDADNPVVGDLFLSAGTVALTSSLPQDVGQEIYTRLKLFQGEWFLDATIGTPWFQSILGIKAPRAVVAQILRNVLSSVPGVAQVTRFDIVTNAARLATLTWAVRTRTDIILTSEDFAPFVIADVASKPDAPREEES